MPLNLYQTTLNLNRPNDNDAMDPTSVYALATGVINDIQATIRAISTDQGGLLGVGGATNAPGYPWYSLLGLIGSWSGGLAVSYISATQFSIQGNQTFYYNIARRVRAFVTAGTITGTVTAASPAGGITTVTVQWDGSSALDSGLTDVQPSCLNPSQNAIPGNAQTQSNNPLYVVIDNGGSGVAYTDTLNPIVPPLPGLTYPVGPIFVFQFNQTISGANPTVNLHGSGGLLGPIALVDNFNQPLQPDNFVAGMIGAFVFDGTNFQLVGDTYEVPFILTASNGGAGNTYTATPVPPWASYADWLDVPVLAQFTQANPGPPVSGVVATYLNVTGTSGPLSPIQIVKDGGTSLQQDDITAGQILQLVYDGTYFQVIGGLKYKTPAAGPGSTNPTLPTPATISATKPVSTTALAALTTSPGSISLTAPAGGGPFRLTVSWFCAVGPNGSTAVAATVYFAISDGAYLWAKGNANVSGAGNRGAAQGCETSPGTYDAGATVTIQLLAVADVNNVTAGGLTATPTPANGGGLASTITAWFVPSN